MNLHKELSLVKKVLAMLVVAVLVAVVCLVVGNQRGMLAPDSVQAGVTDFNEPEILTDATVSAGDTVAVFPTSGTDSAVTTTPDTTAAAVSTTAVPHSPVVVLPPDYHPSREVCSGRFTVTSESANVRVDADKDARLVQTIHAGESYEVIAQKPSSSGVLWLELILGDGVTGYVSSSYGNYEGMITNGKIYLTFDDGPSENTLRILDTLDNYGVKATFFVIYHPNQESVYRKIVERGHTIALHSYTHKYSQIYSGEDAFYQDINRLSDYVYDLTGVRSDVLRFPGGSSNTISQKYCKGIMSRLTSSVQEKGYSYYDWDVDSGDADAVTVAEEQIIRNIKNRVGNRREAIILMHDTAVKTTTADALPEIIEYLQQRGYQILPITKDTHTSHMPVNN